MGVQKKKDGKPKIIDDQTLTQLRITRVPLSHKASPATKAVTAKQKTIYDVGVFVVCVGARLLANTHATVCGLL